jgi:hypothetical protein
VDDNRDYSKDLSTSALAKALEKPLPDVFHQLVDLGLIKRDGKNWELTPEGKAKGGLYKDGGKNIGRYIVWPETFKSEMLKPITAVKEANVKYEPQITGVNDVTP